MADKDGMERKVYLLPEELVERIKAYQSSCGLPSEVEAARRLLSEALQARDSIDEIMKQVRDQFQKDRDLRALSREVLSSHILVTKIEIEDNELRFVIRNLDAGKITRKGVMFTGSANDDGWINSWETWPKKEKKPSSSWSAQEEEIPF
ncbi:hypothetical protein GOB83_13770 [Acetobacter fabarum]|uniref:hypothetical protein n=1 Tax=Acetobacter fabarum TaxID=483199 RepID=UPI0014046249|nr:hypothetical protein [Acetobacter fabarum]NHO43222.1 hypothetical protein [Acetobacter fabarum]GBQ36077.1 hypothetical protein AA19596_1905 [Acetobacter fabarum DSM 19596]